MYGALSLILLCFYKIVQIVFYTISYAFLTLNWVVKICDWTIDLVQGLFKTLMYTINASVTVERKIVYAYEFCGTEKKRLVSKLRNPKMHS